VKGLDQLVRVRARCLVVSMATSIRNKESFLYNNVPFLHYSRSLRQSQSMVLTKGLLLDDSHSHDVAPRTTMLLRNIFTPFIQRASSLSASFPLASTSSASSSYSPPSTSSSIIQQVRHRNTLTPRRTKYRKAHKGRIPVHTGGSTSGTTLEHGDFGIRVKEPVRLTAKQLQSAQEALRRGIKPIKGSRVYLRVFPDIPVCIKVRAGLPRTLHRSDHRFLALNRASPSARRHYAHRATKLVWVKEKEHSNTGPAGLQSER